MIHRDLLYKDNNLPIKSPKNASVLNRNYQLRNTLKFRSFNDEFSSISRYNPLPWEEPNRTMSPQRLDNGPIEIQCCQMLNKHTLKPRNDTDVMQKLGGSTAFKSKHDKCNKILSKPAEIRRKFPHPNGVWSYDGTTCQQVWRSATVAGTACVMLRAVWMVTATVGMSCGLDYIYAFVTKAKLIIWSKRPHPFTGIWALLHLVTTALCNRTGKQ